MAFNRSKAGVSATRARQRITYLIKRYGSTVEAIAYGADLPVGTIESIRSGERARISRLTHEALIQTTGQPRSGPALVGTKQTRALLARLGASDEAVARCAGITLDDIRRVQRERRAPAHILGAIEGICERVGVVPPPPHGALPWTDADKTGTGEMARNCVRAEYEIDADAFHFYLHLSNTTMEAVAADCFISRRSLQRLVQFPPRPCTEATAEKLARRLGARPDQITTRIEATR